jgi:hypothetical protein
MLFNIQGPESIPAMATAAAVHAYANIDGNVYVEKTHMYMHTYNQMQIAIVDERRK